MVSGMIAGVIPIVAFFLFLFIVDYFDWRVSDSRPCKKDKTNALRDSKNGSS